ncbi:XRE family transcriptional regulator [Cognatishimia sp. SS12]|uniref:helix-turn-helix domain-containing protein n=1 Tax=Cognatishimia sp. SS12 TaxID=2979465 RepID=UPI0023315323|nr:XRE family transcriptional regulator [Cognatishimia sp. SS12]MDC0739647.1 XRE family transcriptional regulator [Cognatishimia sp. SS12]
MTPSELIARAIQRERQRADISLTALAQQAGLAKSTLSQLEAGKGNPSVETLWSIAAALGVPFSHLFEMPEPEVKLIRATEGVGVSSDHADFSTTLLDKCPAARRRDIYRAKVLRGEDRRANPHPAGTVEHVIVISGTVTVGPVDKPATLNTGDYYRYPADVAHQYVAECAEAQIVCIMESLE